MTLALLGNTLLRTAITRNLVTFPAQVQPFMKRTNGDLQERIVQLYFVRGWSVRNICDRYAIGKAMVHKLLAEWRVRAIESGCIQEIEPGCLSVLEPEISGTRRVDHVDEDKERVDEPAFIEHPHIIPEPAGMVYTGPLPAPVPAADPSAAMSAARSV